MPLAQGRVPPPVLAGAIAYCDVLTAACSRSFYVATALLPKHKRQAIRVIYAVCRISDDLVDTAPHGAEQALAGLRGWRTRLLGAEAGAAADDPVIAAWAAVRRRYCIPHHYLEQLLDGLAQDVRPRHFATFEQLAAYAYEVASTVGLMSMHVIGFSNDAAVQYAVKLGLALQLTNILRDVGADWQAGRVYLPANELAQFGLAESDLAAGRVDERWRAFMRFQIARNRQLYAEAWPGMRLLHADGRVAVAAAADLYRAILNAIEANDYDVFRRRAQVSDARKLLRLPGIWWHNR
jgi:15-cis-phytoene synthase